MKLQQFKNGQLIYEANPNTYNYGIHQLLNNNAQKIIIKYPTTTIVITPEVTPAA